MAKSGTAFSCRCHQVETFIQMVFGDLHRKSMNQNKTIEKIARTHARTQTPIIPIEIAFDVFPTNDLTFTATHSALFLLLLSLSLSHFLLNITFNHINGRVMLPSTCFRVFFAHIHILTYLFFSHLLHLILCFYFSFNFICWLLLLLSMTSTQYRH